MLTSCQLVTIISNWKETYDYKQYPQPNHFILKNQGPDRKSKATTATTTTTKRTSPGFQFLRKTVKLSQAGKKSPKTTKNMNLCGWEFLAKRQYYASQSRRHSYGGPPHLFPISDEGEDSEESETLGDLPPEIIQKANRYKNRRRSQPVGRASLVSNNRFFFSFFRRGEDTCFLEEGIRFKSFFVSFGLFWERVCHFVFI